MRLTTIEKKVIDKFQKNDSMIYTPNQIPVTDDWIYFGISVLLKIGAMVRKMRGEPMRELVHYKQDGSPVTKKEKDIEAFVRKELTCFYPDAKLFGEESGGRVPDAGIAIAIDPIDGTWAFVNRTETFATSLLFLKNRDPFLGMVLNPSTGELGYSPEKNRTRLLQLSMFGEGDLGYDLPMDRATPDSTLINIHPQSRVDILLEPVFQQWRQKDLNMVRMPGGSPSFALLETAKGSFSYVNLWAKRPAAPYDLAAGINLVRSAGGDVVDLYGEPVRLMDHSGPFVASLDSYIRNKIVVTVRQAIKGRV
jgi:fructose-1,6-bisphosphatase/inositol monophosphatase family enzyme